MKIRKKRKEEKLKIIIFSFQTCIFHENSSIFSDEWWNALWKICLIIIFRYKYLVLIALGVHTLLKPFSTIWKMCSRTSSVADLGCLSRIRFFPSWIPDLGPKRFRIPDPGSASKNLSSFYPKNCFWALDNMIRDVHPGSGSWIFTHTGSWIQGSKMHRIPDPQHCVPEWNPLYTGHC